MKLTTGMVALVLAAGTAWGQNPAIIQNTKDALQKVQQQKTAASNAALQGTSPSKPSGAVPAKAPANAPTVIPTKAPAAAGKPSVVPAKAPVQAAVAKPQVVPAKATPAPAKNAVPAKAAAPAPTSSATKVQAPAKAQTATKTQSPMAPKVSPAKPAVKVAAKPEVKAAPKAAKAKTTGTEQMANGEASGLADAPKPDKQEDKKYSMTGKRDPFISPVVNRQSGSGCSTGKKCLDIEQIALHGVVKSDNGMIAVVTNSLNKAYFLRENDPVFNGYVVKITVDSIVFKQTFQDRLGKSFTKDVVKRILTPAV
jgi:Tfp pilus assembly protein PilP